MILSEQLHDLLEELIDDWGDGRLERVRDLVAEMEAQEAGLREALALAQSMIRSGEKETEQSRDVFDRALTSPTSGEET